MFSSAVTAENAKQAIKTAIAGVVAMYMTQLFRLPEGYWAAISALIVMQSNVGATLSASRTRLAGTAVGAVVGGVFVALWGANVLGLRARGHDCLLRVRPSCIWPRASGWQR